MGSAETEWKENYQIHEINHSIQTVTKHELSELIYQKISPRGAAEKDVTLPIAFFCRKSTNTTCYKEQAFSHTP